MAIQKHRSNTTKPQGHAGAARAGTAHLQRRENAKRYAIIGALVVASFFGAYQFARAQNSTGVGAATASAAGVPSAGSSAVAQTQNGLQTISVDVSSSYNPNVIRLKAGVPAAITFSQAQGCTSIVQSSDLGFQEDLSAGPKTVQLKGLTAGTYSFACGMNMVRGQIVVE